MCLCVCVCVSVYVCHDVCPDDLTMKDWCHTNDILEKHSWRYLVVQVMSHALMTSQMTSVVHKVSQTLKLLYLHQYFSYSVDQKLKISEMPIAFLLVYSISGITSGKKFVAISKWRNGGHFEIFLILTTVSLWPQIWKGRPKLCQKSLFHGDDAIDDVTWWHQSRPFVFRYNWNKRIFMITTKRT